MSAPEITDWPRDQIRRGDESRFEQRVARAMRTKTHNIIPYRWFAVASSECRDTFRDGHFNACVCLTQAVAEGLAKFLLKAHSMKAANDQQVRVARLHQDGIISDQCRQAFVSIIGADRNVFHHLNEDIPTDWDQIEERAEDCVVAIYDIESEIFAYSVTDRGITPTRQLY